MFLGFLVLGLVLAHLLFQSDDMLDRRQLPVALGGFESGTLFRRHSFEQRIRAGHSDGVANSHQFHRLHPAGRLHVAQHPGHVRGELLVLHSRNGLRANAFEQVYALVDGTQLQSKGPRQMLLAARTIDGATDHVVLLNGSVHKHSS